MMTMKSALITGAASGIGKACAERMAQEGYGVVVADVNLPAAEELAAKLAAEGLSAIAVHMDVADEQEVEAGFDKMMETYGSCDLVMSNAGVQIVHPFEEYPFADWRKMMAIHADGAFLVSRAAYTPDEGLRQGRPDRVHRLRTVLRGLQAARALTTSPSTAWPDWQASHRPGGRRVRHLHLYHLPQASIKTPLVEKQIPEQAASLGHYGGGSGEERHAAGYRGRGVHHGGGCSQHAGIPVQGSGRSDGPDPCG